MGREFQSVGAGRQNARPPNDASQWRGSTSRPDVCVRMGVIREDFLEDVRSRAAEFGIYWILYNVVFGRP